MNKEQYWDLRRRGICVECLKPNPTTEYGKCLECRIKERQYHKETKAFYEKMGICTRCHKEVVELGKKHCSNCLEILNGYNVKYSQTAHTEEKRDRRNKHLKLKYHERIEQGLCGRCGKHKIYRTSKAKCYECLLEERRRSRERYAKNVDIRRDDRVKNGLCHTCGKPFIPGKYKMCDECRNLRSELAKARGETEWVKANRKWVDGYFRSQKIQQGSKTQK